MSNFIGTPAHKTVVPDYSDTTLFISGVTIDWSKVTPESTDKFVDGYLIKAGNKYIRYGTVLVKINLSGKYAPYDSGSSDGRNTVNKGSAVILNKTILENELKHAPTDHPEVIDSGYAIKENLLIGGHVDTIQEVLITTTSGFFRLSNGTTFTGNLPANISITNLKTELENLYGAGNIAIALKVQGTYLITFKGALANTLVPLMNIDDSLLTSGVGVVNYIKKGKTAPTVAEFERAFPTILYK